MLGIGITTIGNKGVSISMEKLQVTAVAFLLICLTMDILLQLDHMVMITMEIVQGMFVSFNGTKEQARGMHRVEISKVS